MTDSEFQQNMNAEGWLYWFYKQRYNKENNEISYCGYSESCASAWVLPKLQDDKGIETKSANT